ncbi:MAG: hypothetical protein ACTSV2_05475 [Candidatus Thorarchaeota archaeon]
MAEFSQVELILDLCIFEIYFDLQTGLMTHLIKTLDGLCNTNITDIRKVLKSEQLAIDITRHWRYDQAPVQLHENEDGPYVSTAPPAVKELWRGLIDTVDTRERELRRIQKATEYLKGQAFVTKSLRECCRRIEQYCGKQFALVQEHPSQKTPELFLEALKKIQGFIMEDPRGAECWYHLVPHRNGLVNLLNSENREVMEDMIKTNPDILLLYGNNLFLAVLAALGKDALTIAERLWDTVAEWTFYQIGMDIEDEEVKWVYSFQAILSNLRTRARISPERVGTEVRKSLAPYGLQDDVLEEIVEKAREVLEEEGVRFLEE